MKRQKQDSTWKNIEVPRGKHHNKTETKTTVSLYLSKNLVEKARNHRLNLSRITEQALSSILDYLETQNSEYASNDGSAFLSRGSFLKESRVPRAGFEPATTRSSASPPAAQGNWVERSPRLSYLGACA